MAKQLSQEQQQKMAEGKAEKKAQKEAQIRTEAQAELQKKLDAKEKEILKLKTELDGRQPPKAYLVTQNPLLVEELVLQEIDPNTKIRKIRKNQISPIGITGSSLYEGKRYYFDIAEKEKIEAMLGNKKHLMKDFVEVKDMKKSEGIGSAALEEKLAQSRKHRKDMGRKEDM